MAAGINIVVRMW